MKYQRFFILEIFGSLHGTFLLLHLGTRGPGLDRAPANTNRAQTECKDPTKGQTPPTRPPNTQRRIVPQGAPSGAYALQCVGRKARVLRSSRSTSDECKHVNKAGVTNTETRKHCCAPKTWNFTRHSKAESKAHFFFTRRW